MRTVTNLNVSFQYNRGRRARDAWVFGIVTTEFSPARRYFQVVERWDITRLDPIISNCIQPGTEVSTDDWAAYRGMAGHINNVAAHQVVVYAHHFVDPFTGIHTQEIESCWNGLKLEQRARHGIRKSDLQSYLDERMWRQWRGGISGKLCKIFWQFYPLNMLLPTQHFNLSEFASRYSIH